MKYRKNFVEVIEETTNKRKTFTENGALAYDTSGKNIVDFNFKLSQYRNMSDEDIKNDFTKVYFENPLFAVKFIFFVGDVREGLGERRTFNLCIEWLIENKPSVAKAILKFIPEYTRWDNLAKLVTFPQIHDDVISIIKNQIIEDLANMEIEKNVSLCAKWLPSLNASSKRTKFLAKEICESLNFSPRKYRKTLSALRRYIDVVEVKMSSNDWFNIDYEKVPSQANINYKEAFLRHDYERRIEYLGKLSSDKVKINAKVLQPHEIVRKYSYGGWDLRPYDVVLEELWKALPNNIVNESLIVRDGSGSMCCYASSNSKATCLDVATALSIYCSEHNSEIWKDKFITFSRHPRFVDLSGCTTLRDKLKKCYAEDDCSNTDIEATMDLILETAIKYELSQEEMPESIIIISDMQFDKGRKFNWNRSLFEETAIDYANAGYKIPRICFWNVNSREASTIPMQDNELGLILCSGFSINNLNMFMSGEINPYKILIEQLNSTRYNIIEDAVKDIV